MPSGNPSDDQASIVDNRVTMVDSQVLIGFR